MAYASLLIKRYQKHLERWGIESAQVVVQTDRGGEFSGGERNRRDRGFVHTVSQSGARHVFTPPRWPNANADVEAVHRLIEEEFFNLERYEDPEDFMRKATLYQHYFNFARPNGYKGGKTPWEIVSADHPALLEREFRSSLKVGHDVPGLDESAREMP